MRGHGHDGAGAVGHQDIIGYPDRDFRAVDGIDGRQAVNADAGLVFRQLRALEIGLSGCCFTIGYDLIVVLDLVLELLDVGMLGREHHVGHAEQGVRAGGVYAELFFLAFDLEIDLSTVGAADPVALLDLDAVDVIHQIQVVDQLVGIGRDLQHPLALHFLDDRGAAALADAAHDLFIGQTDLAAGAPVDGHLGLVGQAFLEELQEDPLGPVIVIGIGGVYFAFPVEGIPQGMQLCLKARHVVLRNDLRMNVVLDGVVFRGQAEGVPTHGEQHIVALHTALSCQYFDTRIRLNVSDMHSCA